jgi:hypothetical protein
MGQQQLDILQIQKTMLGTTKALDFISCSQNKAARA